MKPSRTVPLAIACLSLFVVLPGLAQSPAPTTLDSGRFVVFSQGEPVATEDFMYEQRHDSLFVTSRVDRHARSDDGSTRPYMKSMQLLANADDWGALLYLSTEKFDGHRVNRTVTPHDTTITVTVERDAYGVADELVRAPGRIYVLDAGMYTLFDVIARNLYGRIFGSRPLAIVALGDQNQATTALATPAGKDTIEWGHKRVIAERIVIGDSTSTFMLWMSPTGRMLRLESTSTDFVVMREPPAIPPARKRRRPPTP